MGNLHTNPRILIVTPEVTYLPDGMGNLANHLTAKAGGLADVSAGLVSALFRKGADVHVALPDYRSIFGNNSDPLIKKQLNAIKRTIPDERIHLAEDRSFFYLNHIYSNYGFENAKIALAFQREVINNIIFKVQPDLIHCNDWMTGLIPAMARQMNIPCLFTVHNIFTVKSSLAYIEDRGIDAASFWQNLYFSHWPRSYEDVRDADPVDFLASGVFAAHFVNTVSPTFLAEVAEGRHDFVEENLRQELANKAVSGCAGGILNAPDPSFDPIGDKALVRKFGPEDHIEGKQENKLFLQKTLGMVQDKQAPIFFWPSRLDTVQKGCHLLSEIIYKVVSRYWKEKLQIVFVADGEFQQHFKDIVRFHNISDRIAVCDFDEQLSRLAYGASDFVLMPSLFEPCGLPQMIGPIYGALPVAHDTGGIHDTVEHMDIERQTGNGFLFETFDSNGLFWAVEQAMFFFKQSNEVKEQQIKGIMRQSKETFNHETTAQQYIDLYEKMLQRPLINRIIPLDKAEDPTKKQQKVDEVPDKIVMFGKKQEIESYETNQLGSGAHIKTQEEYCIGE